MIPCDMCMRQYSCQHRSVELLAFHRLIASSVQRVLLERNLLSPAACTQVAGHSHSLRPELRHRTTAVRRRSRDMSRENPVDGARHDARHPGLIATTGPASGPPALKPTVSRAGRLQCSVCQYRHANCRRLTVGGETAGGRRSHRDAESLTARRRAHST